MNGQAILDRLERRSECAARWAERRPWTVLALFSLGYFSLAIAMSAIRRLWFDELFTYYIALLPRFAGSSVPRLSEVSLDPRVVLFALGASVASALVFSLVPALSLSNGHLVEWMRPSASRRHAGLRNFLIVAEVALSVILLVATRLTLRSFAALLEAEPGFRPEKLLTLRLSVSHADYPEQENRRVLFERLQESLRALPGVVSSLLLAFTVSFDEFVIAFFLAGNEPTLPLIIWSQLRFPGKLPGVLALGSCILLVSFTMVVLSELIRRHGHAKGP